MNIGSIVTIIYVVRLLGLGAESIRSMDIVICMLLVGLVIYGVYALIRGLKM